jgi:DNA-binding NarL/FixJ family response regulator
MVEKTRPGEEARMRVLLADGQTSVRSALRLVLEQNPLMSMVDEVTDTGSLLARVRTLCPDLVLLDWELPGQAAGKLLLTLRQVCPTLYVIALSSHPEASQAARAAGADAFFSKTDPPDRLLAAIHEHACRAIS